MSVNAPIIHLCIPQLFQPLDLWNKDFLFEANAPYMTQLLRQFDVIDNQNNQGLDAALFNTIGMKENPVANYRFQVHTKTKPNQTLLCADPVHFEVGMKDITLTQTITDLSDDEADEIIDVLNKHFKQDGLLFSKGSNCCWYIALPQKELVKTIPLNEVLRKNIANFLPRNSTTMNWKIILNEAQMILHSCAVNQQREMAGLATINSLWFWGGGNINKQNLKHDVSCVYYSDSSDAEIKAKTVALAAKCRTQKIGKSVSNILANMQGSNVVILDQLFLASINDDVDLYQHQLTFLDEEIIKPLVEAWQKGAVQLNIDSCDGRIIKPIKPSAWKFWKNKSPSLLEIARQ